MAQCGWCAIRHTTPPQFVRKGNLGEREVARPTTTVSRANSRAMASRPQRMPSRLVTSAKNTWRLWHWDKHHPAGSRSGDQEAMDHLRAAGDRLEPEEDSGVL